MQTVFRRKGQRGVALVITLILLAVISTLAIAFLGLTQRETGSVDAMARTTDAEVAADSALERAKAEITAVYPDRNQNVTANGPNILGPEMMVSVCCQQYDLVARQVVPYDRLVSTDRLATNRNYDAAPPVFIQTSSVVNASSPLDDRFYLDLNRNGIFEDTGFVTNTLNNSAGVGRFQTELDPAGNPVLEWRIGDPQWIGVLQNPRRPHSANNRFIGRYAFMVLPAGQTLDINWIHNEGVPRSTGTPGYYRNQGVGGWEMNLGAFLADLNTNYWGSGAAIPYGYLTNAAPNQVGGSGVAFVDARELLFARYGGALANLNRADQIFPITGVGGFTADDVDQFANGFSPNVNPDDNDFPNQPWPGSDSRSRYFSAHEFLNATMLPKVGVPDQFRDRLQNASKQGNSYDRYTMYRMLAQLGADSPEESEEDLGKININYVNVGGIKASELIPWTDTAGRVLDAGMPGPDLFVNSVVTNFLAREFPVMVDKAALPAGTLFAIPVYVNNSWFGPQGRHYSGRIHQTVQLAANILAATTGAREGESYPYYPFIFKPQFWVSPENNVFITNYSISTLTESYWNSTVKWRDLDAGERPTLPDDCVYGIPVIVSARKGYPAPSEFLVRTHAQFVRTLEMFRSSRGGAIDRTNQTLEIGITNVFALEAWNSYASNYAFGARSIEVVFGGRMTAVATNSNQRFAPVTLADGDRIQTNAWRGGQTITSRVFTQPVVTNWSRTTALEQGGVTNQWAVSVTNRMLFYLVDINRGIRRIVDVVSLVATNHFDINAELQRPSPQAGTDATRNLWNSGRTLPAQAGSLSLGVRNQIQVNTDTAASTDADWANYSASGQNKSMGIDGWNTFKNDSTITNKVLGFAAVRRMVQTNSFRVNDPLVHYTGEDMWDGYGEGTVPMQFTAYGLGDPRVGRYRPWGGTRLNPASTQGAAELDPMMRDPGVSSSDQWDFPTNKFPNLGWLGRVHRGTPWQSIYFKALNTNASKIYLLQTEPKEPTMSMVLGEMAQRWRNLCRKQDSDRLFPTNDWRMADLFTTAIHPNAARGRLSINQTNLAAWSAALSGVEIAEVSNFDLDGTKVDFPTNYLAEPGTYSDILPRIVEGVNQSRPRRQFNKLSEIFAVPEVSYESPTLVDAGFESYAPNPIRGLEVTDSDYERIPEKVLSLLKVGEPRFVIYAWGQSLKPARLGFEAINRPLNGPSIDPDTKIVNNYQVTGEVATRAVVRAVFPERDLADPNKPVDFKRPRLVVESFNIIPLE